MPGLVDHLTDNGCETFFSDPERATKYFRSLGYATAIQTVDQLNLAINPMHAGESNIRDSSGLIYLADEDVAEDPATDQVDYIGPHAYLTSSLLRNAYEVACQLPDNKSIGDLGYLSIFLTHRYYDGNTRSAATTRSLFQVGYNNSDASRMFYDILGTGINGIKSLGLALDTTFLQKRYAQAKSEELASRYRHRKAIPDKISDLRASQVYGLRPELPVRARDEASFMLMERYMNIPLALSYLLGNHKRVKNYLEPDGKGGKQLSLEAMFHTMTAGELQGLVDYGEVLKADFVRSVISSFCGEDNLYGMPYQDLVKQLEVGTSV